MILRAGLAATHLVTFADGQPDGDVTWELLADDGTVLDSGTITPAADQISVLIPLSSEATALPDGILQDTLDVTWSYAVSGAIRNGEARYMLEARLPLGISPDGVRTKLGVTASELPNTEISLVSSYLIFVDAIGIPPTDAIGIAQLRIRDAIEAQAALALIPTMAVRIATSESSGTNEFKRQDIDWGAIAADLATMIDLGYLAVDPTFDAGAVTGELFLLATPAVDPITGA
jgi:hypothetical protein